MKYNLNNKILEAVNRGIKFALDDYEDNNIQGQTNSKVKYQGGMNEYIDLMNDVVDLGLPSGTLWCKYNLGVDINNITSSNQLIGDYYAWGEIEPNKLNNGLYNFSWYNYKLARGAGNQLKKYLNGNTDFAAKKDLHYYTLKPGESIQYNDNLVQLEPEDDAAYQNKKLHNYKFHIPTKEQFEELINYTSTTENIYAHINNGKLEFSDYITYDNKYNIYGILLTSKINGNQLFFPFGSYKDSDCNNPFLGGHYWTSSLYQNYPEESYYMCCGSDFIKIYNGKRYRGLNIRPVINL